MPDGDGLASAVANIDNRMEQIAGAIAASRRQIDQATRAVEDVRRNQASQQVELTRLNAQLEAAIRENRDGIADLRRRLDDQAASVVKLTGQASALQVALDTLIAQQLEEKLRRQRESEWADFVLKLHGMLRSLHDPAVRVVFASDAMDAIDLREIRSTSFLGPADKKAMDDTLYKIEQASKDPSNPSRAEADAFMALRKLDHDAAERVSRWNDELDDLRRETASAERALQQARRLVEEGEAPEAEDSQRRRRSLRLVFTALAISIALASVAGAVAVDAGFAWALLASLLFAVLAWVRSDSHRQGVLARRRKEQAAAEQLLSDLCEQLPRLNFKQKSELAAIRTRWQAAMLNMPKEADSDEPLGAVRAARPIILRAKKDWESAHPEVAVLTR